jgi:DNA-binding MarR family transcriptional regulator
MEKLSEKIIQLRLATRRVTAVEGRAGKAKSTLSLKSKILFLIRQRSATPVDIMHRLGIVKTNFSLLIKQMIREGLVKKINDTADRREIRVSITEDGKKYLSTRLDIIESVCNRTFNQAEYDEALKKLDDALSVLDFI